MEVIDILLATYNGEKYIKTQILSLLSQTYGNWRLIIHDDGSTDKTVEIIKELQAIDNRINLVEDGIKCGGAAANFMHLLKNHSSSEYAIFCDQDDIWLERKIEDLLAVMIEKDEVDKPVLVYCDGYAWDEDNIIHQESISINHARKLQDFIMFNGGYQGCSIMMNKKLLDMTKSYSGYIYHHDDLVSLIAHSFGNVYFLPKQLMLYRQHSAAVTGNKDFKKKIFYGLFNNSGYLISKEHYEVKKNFYEFFKDSLGKDEDQIFQLYFKFCLIKTRFMRAFFIIPTNITYGGSKNKLAFKVLLQRLFNI